MTHDFPRQLAAESPGRRAKGVFLVEPTRTRVGHAGGLVDRNDLRGPHVAGVALGGCARRPDNPGTPRQPDVDCAGGWTACARRDPLARLARTQHLDLGSWPAVARLERSLAQELLTDPARHL